MKGPWWVIPGKIVNFVFLVIVAVLSVPAGGCPEYPSIDGRLGLRRN